MRGVVMFILVGGIAGGLFTWQKQHENKPPTATSQNIADPPDSPRQTYKHDWAKHSLDTTHSVIDQIKRQRKDDDLKDAVGRR